MPLDGHARYAGLSDLLGALRSQGIPIGPGEISRLQHLLNRQPQLDRQGLKSLLSALLVKTLTQQQTFEALFEDWYPDSDVAWQQVVSASPQPEPSSASQPTSTVVEVDFPEAEAPLPPRWPIPAALLGSLLVGLLVWQLYPRPSVVIDPPTPATSVTVSEPTTNQDPSLPHKPVNTVWYWQTEPIEPEAIQVSPRLGPFALALIGSLALLLALALWWRYRQRIS